MIDTLWVGYKDVDGEFSANSSTLNVAFVAGSEDFDSVRVGTINVGNGSIVTNESELEEMLGSSDFNSASATSLQPLPGSDTITVNVNHIEAQISLGGSRARRPLQGLTVMRSPRTLISTSTLRATSRSLGLMNFNQDPR